MKIKKFINFLSIAAANAITKSEGPVIRHVLTQLTCGFLCALVLFLPVRVQAVTINVVSAQGLSGLSVFNQAFGAAQPGPLSYGLLTTLANVAGDYWESRLVGDLSLTIQVGFSTLSSQILGSTADLPTIAAIAINQSNSIPWFFDPTPLDAAEFGGFETMFADLGAGAVNVGINYMTSTVVGYDAFTVLLHEIGHALSYASQGQLLTSIEIQAPLPYAGSVVPMHEGHIDFPLVSALMGQFLTGLRQLPSDIDILTITQMRHQSTGGDIGVVLNAFAPTSEVPEPGTLQLLAAGLALLLLIHVFPTGERRADRTGARLSHLRADLDTSV